MNEQPSPSRFILLFVAALQDMKERRLFFSIVNVHDSHVIEFLHFCVKVYRRLPCQN
jgi:hypothetical protein